MGGARISSDPGVNLVTSSEQHGANLVFASHIMCLNCLYLLRYWIVPNIIFFYIEEVSTDNLV